MSRWSVADVMTAGAVSVEEGTPFKEIVDLMEAHHINAVPVVDSFDRVLGVVSSADLVPKIEFSGTGDQAHLFESRKHRQAREKSTATAAAELMTAPALTVLPQTSLVEAAKIMETAGLKRLPVVNDLGHLVGMVTRSDLLKVYLRSDADLRREIVDEVLTDIAGLEPVEVTVEVDDGVVTLLGELDLRSTVTATVRHVEKVAGVVDVINDLSYRNDDITEPPTHLRTPIAH
jgi:CBS-domain-containing membrane protein